MNILFDFIPLQYANGIGGHASFTKRILDDLLARKDASINLLAAMDSTMPNGDLFNIQEVATKNHIKLIDISKEKLSVIIYTHHIDVLFISIGQFYSNYDLTDIHCKTIMFIHDIFDIERNNNKLDAIIYDKYKDSIFSQIKRIVNLTSGRWNRQMKKCYKNIMPLYAQSETISYTVSNYTKEALRYYFPNLDKDIRVCYSPLKKYVPCKDNLIDNKVLSELIHTGRPFLFMIAANRRYKNPKIVIEVFQHIRQEYPELRLLTLKYGKSVCPQHIDIPFLSDNDLEIAYKNAKGLIFPSFFEGFGYPPIEAAKYGTPTIASNVTSIPEILGDAGVYFSPFYPADLYRAIRFVFENDLSQKVKERYKHITLLQERHANMLINELTTK